MKKTKKLSKVDLPVTIPERVNIYSLSPPKHNFPGGDWGKDYLNAQGIVFCDNPLEANIFLLGNSPFHCEPSCASGRIMVCLNRSLCTPVNPGSVR